MINQLLKWSVLLTIWKKYGSAIKVLPLLLLLILLVYALHGDYVEYAEVSDEKQYLALSFLIKWLAIFAVIGVYWLYIKKVLTSKQNASLTARSLKDRLKKRKPEPTKDPHEMDESSDQQAAFERIMSANDDESNNLASATDAAKVSDPFNAIRKKKHLRSEADIILDKKSKTD